MLDNLMQVLDEQHRGDKKWTSVVAPSSVSKRKGAGTNMDGAVNRDEFDTVQPRYDDESSPMDRERMEKRVFRLTPTNHRFVAADGSKGIVYFDSRGRAADALLNQMDMGELLRLLDVYGDKQTARSPMPKDASKSKDAGYKVPFEEAVEEGWGSLEERGIPLDHQGNEIKKQLGKRNIVVRIDPEMGTDRIIGYKVHVSNDDQAKTVMKLFGGKHFRRLGFVSVPSRL